ncbi:tetratricopeptide repeat protein [Rhodohalobacter sp. 8-1]|uniref:tetratricopeptide repeat protein n=1 Tax=Rhodohalobacter sp. 8-1 TaxID=3131972 RepID=UPI0030EC780E
MKRLLTTAFTLLLFTTGAMAQDNLLGKIEFPNSGAESAQADFIEGVKFLHNFEYADAARAFRRAQDEDPEFAMAYWGEAMTHNHPIWMRQDRNAAMEILNQLGETVEDRQAKAPTQREKDYLMAIETLYGNTPEAEGKSKNERDLLYNKAMEELHQTYPEDHEATAFYGLSILGTAHDGRDFGIYMRAAAELFEVWNDNNEHPGAAHYLIHSFDDPVHAPLGLPMAKAYSEIAPAAAHAQHMTSHIFLALGMWDDVIEANIVARDVQTSRQQELGEETTVCGHYPWWLQYGYLQDGNVEEAEQVLQACSERIAGTPTMGEKWHYAVMRGHQIVDTENWSGADSWTADMDPQNRPAVNYYYVSALASARMGRVDEAQNHLEMLIDTPESPERNIRIKQVESLILVKNGDMEKGLEVLNEAVVAESELPVDFGPPTIVKPSYELLGDVLSELSRYEEAIDAYEKQLERTPDRRRSLIGKESISGMASK